MKKAQYFITCHELPMQTINELTPQRVRSLLVTKPKKRVDEHQLAFPFYDEMLGTTSAPVTEEVTPTLFLE